MGHVPKQRADSSDDSEEEKKGDFDSSEFSSEILFSKLENSSQQSEFEEFFEDFCAPKVITGNVLVTRNPCHFSSDISMLTAVDRPEF